jgi:hypothetical protein
MTTQSRYEPYPVDPDDPVLPERVNTHDTPDTV